MPTTIFRGPGMENAVIHLDGYGTLYLVPPIPIQEDDHITVEGVVEVYDGDPITIKHGDREVGTVENSGTFTRAFTALDDGNEITMTTGSDAAHHLGYLEISRV